MKTKRVFTTVALILLGSMMVMAQEKAEIWSWIFIEAEKGKSADLEKAIKDKTEKFNKTAVDPINTWRVMSGSRTGQLVRAIGPKDWSYYEKPNEGFTYWEQNVGSFIGKNSGREFYARSKEMSYNGSGKTTTPKYVEVTEYEVKADRLYDFASFVRDIVKSCNDNKSKARFSTYRNVSGGSGNKYVIVSSYESLTEMDDSNENWPQWFNKMKGSEAAWTKEWTGAQGSFEIYGVNSYLCSHVPELSSK